MRLYLSSMRVGTDRSALRSLVGPGRHAAIILNALDQSKAEREDAFEREVSDLADLGFDGAALDLREYFGDSAALSGRLESVDLVWVVGGNTFALADAVHRSQFGEAVSALLRDDLLTYGGYSAGACITGPDLWGCHLIDDPAVVEHDGSEPGSTLGLGWVPWRTVPHWRSDHPESRAAGTAVRDLTRRGLPFRALRDGQAIVVDGASVTLV